MIRDVAEFPYDPLLAAKRPLPGVLPLGDEMWLWRTPSYAAQMAQREELLREKRSEVLAMSAQSTGAIDELFRTVLYELDGGKGFERLGQIITCPDGRVVDLDADEPLAVIGRLVQCDFCILQKLDGSDEHIMTAAILCFPASWRLSEKFMRPLGAIHETVTVYDAQISKRVQRLFDGVQVGRSLWRGNALWYKDPTLFQPRSVMEPRQKPGEDARYFRSERQVVMRLPDSNAVVFSILTTVQEQGHADG